MKKNSRNSGHSPKYYGNGKYVTYCPVCPPAMAGDPRTAPGMSVNPAKLPKEGRCKNGHTWVPCRG